MYFRGRKNFTVMSEVFNHTLFRNMEIMLDKMTKQNAPKFAINLEYTEKRVSTDVVWFFNWS